MLLPICNAWGNSANIWDICAPLLAGNWYLYDNDRIQDGFVKCAKMAQFIGAEGVGWGIAGQYSTVVQRGSLRH